MGMFAPSHLILIALLIIILFGGKKIPELMRGIGKGVRDFSDAQKDTRRKTEDDINDKDKPAKTPSATTQA